MRWFSRRARWSTRFAQSRATRASTSTTGRRPARPVPRRARMRPGLHGPRSRQETRGTRMSDETLANFRAALDVVDRELVEHIAKRLDICRQVAEHKRRNGIPMMQPDRMRAVKARVAAMAEAHDVSPEFAVALYDLIIDETCRLEDALISRSA